MPPIGMQQMVPTAKAAHVSCIDEEDESDSESVQESELGFNEYAPGVAHFRITNALDILEEDDLDDSSVRIPAATAQILAVAALIIMRSTKFMNTVL